MFYEHCHFYLLLGKKKKNSNVQSSWHFFFFIYLFEARKSLNNIKNIPSDKMNIFVKY